VTFWRETLLEVDSRHFRYPFATSSVVS
jgi:hypothetical protein